MTLVTAFVGVREEGGVPRAVVISGNDPKNFAIIDPTHRWRVLAQVHSRKSYERAARLARALVKHEFPTLEPLLSRE